MSQAQKTIKTSRSTQQDGDKQHACDLEKKTQQIGSEHEEFLLASQMNKFFIKEKERIVEVSKRDVQTIKDENKELRSKLLRIRNKAESAFARRNSPDSYKRVVQEIFNQVKECKKSR